MASTPANLNLSRLSRIVVATVCIVVCASVLSVAEQSTATKAPRGRGAVCEHHDL
jgi:hypothetical protein